VTTAADEYKAEATHVHHERLLGDGPSQNIIRGIGGRRAMPVAMVREPS